MSESVVDWAPALHGSLSSIAIGDREPEPILILGSERPYKVIRVGNIDLNALSKAVYAHAEAIEALNDRLDNIEEKLNALWFAPGMPGANETEERFEAAVLTQEENKRNDGN